MEKVHLEKDILTTTSWSRRKHHDLGYRDFVGQGAWLSTINGLGCRVHRPRKFPAPGLRQAIIFQENDAR